jgi:hypothetical protein
LSEPEIGDAASSPVWVLRALHKKILTGAAAAF